MFEKRGREGQSGKCVGKTRSAEPKKVERKEKDGREIEESIKKAVIALTIGKKKGYEIGNSNTEGPYRQNQNDF